MRGKIGFVCIGQAGGNIGQLLENRGFNCLFINTSYEDLDTLNVKYRFHIPDGQGCARERETAIALVKKHYKSIVEEVNDKLHHQELIYIVFSAGGGTGSGVSPILLDVLTADSSNKKYGAVIILPSLEETLKINLNAYTCYSEVTKLPKLASIFTLDNSRTNKFEINKIFADLFEEVIKIPECKDFRGNIDQRDLLKMLQTRGNAIIATANKENVTSSLLRGLENNIFAPVEKDKSVVYIGLSLTEEINSLDIKKAVGNPFDLFTSYNNKGNIALLTGLSFPESRLEQIRSMINDNREAVYNALANSKKQITDTIDFDFFTENEETRSIDEILRRYS